ncbi:MAG: hypothetical protein U5J97_11605 [Trueperaceae bacterium]|nr:hypothetical protein [Trueperaceae bacterium]
MPVMVIVTVSVADVAVPSSAGEVVDEGEGLAGGEQVEVRGDLVGPGAGGGGEAGLQSGVEARVQRAAGAAPHDAAAQARVDRERGVVDVGDAQRAAGAQRRGPVAFHERAARIDDGQDGRIVRR